MRGTKQVGTWSEMGSFWQPHPTQDQSAPPEGFEIDSRIGAAAPRAPAASREDSCPQAVLKFQPRNCLDYRVRYEPQISLLSIIINQESASWIQLKWFHPLKNWGECFDPSLRNLISTRMTYAALKSPQIMWASKLNFNGQGIIVPYSWKVIAQRKKT